MLGLAVAAKIILQTRPNLHAHFYQSYSGGSYRSREWMAMINQKLELIHHAVTSSKNKTVIFSDVDVQFFRSPISILKDQLATNDMVFQADSPYGNCCTGFFAMRCNERVQRLWSYVHDLVRSSHGTFHDQDALNALVEAPHSSVQCRIAVLSSIFFGGGTLSGKPWEPGRKLDISTGIVMHHANFTRGLVNKIKQLVLVCETYERQLITQCKPTK